MYLFRARFKERPGYLVFAPPSASCAVIPKYSAARRELDSATARSQAVAMNLISVALGGFAGLRSKLTQSAGREYTATWPQPIEVMFVFDLFQIVLYLWRYVCSCRCTLANHEEVHANHR